MESPKKLSILEKINGIKKFICKDDISELENFINENNIDFTEIDLSYKVDIVIYAIENETPIDHIQYLLQKISLDKLDYFILDNNFNKKTPLFSAIGKNNYQLANLLLTQYNSDINCDKGSIFNIFSKQNLLNNKNLKFILNHGYNIQYINNSLIKNLLNTNNDFVEIIHRFYIFDNTFILSMLNRYKKEEPISRQQLKEILSNEKNKIIVSNDLYQLAIEKENYQAVKIFFEYDGSSDAILSDKIKRYQLLEVAVILNDIDFVKLILSYYVFPFKELISEKILAEANKNNNTEILSLLHKESIPANDHESLERINSSSVLNEDSMNEMDSKKSESQKFLKNSKEDPNNSMSNIVNELKQISINNNINKDENKDDNTNMKNNNDDNNNKESKLFVFTSGSNNSNVSPVKSDKWNGFSFINIDNNSERRISYGTLRSRNSFSSTKSSSSPNANNTETPTIPFTFSSSPSPHENLKSREIKMFSYSDPVKEEEEDINKLKVSDSKNDNNKKNTESRPFTFSSSFNQKMHSNIDKNINTSNNRNNNNYGNKINEIDTNEASSFLFGTKTSQNTNNSNSDNSTTNSLSFNNKRKNCDNEMNTTESKPFLFSNTSNMLEQTNSTNHNNSNINNKPILLSSETESVTKQNHTTSNNIGKDVNTENTNSKNNNESSDSKSIFSFGSASSKQHNTSSGLKEVNPFTFSYSSPSPPQPNKINDNNNSSNNPKSFSFNIKNFTNDNDTKSKTFKFTANSLKPYSEPYSELGNTFSFEYIKPDSKTENPSNNSTIDETNSNKLKPFTFGSFSFKEYHQNEKPFEFSFQSAIPSQQDTNSRDQSELKNFSS